MANSFHLPLLKLRLATALAIFLIGVTSMPAIPAAFELVDKSLGIGCQHDITYNAINELATVDFHNFPLLINAKESSKSRY
jgi:hypothetical protein